MYKSQINNRDTEFAFSFQSFLIVFYNSASINWPVQVKGTIQIQGYWTIQVKKALFFMPFFCLKIPLYYFLGLLVKNALGVPDSHK